MANFLVTTDGTFFIVKNLNINSTKNCSVDKVLANKVLINKTSRSLLDFF